MQNENNNVNIVMLRGACLWILIALVLAWSLVGVYNGIDFIKGIFPGNPSRILQAHIDFLLMSALILGFYATKVPLPWHVRWAMVVGAFTNSSLFLLNAMQPWTDPVNPAFDPTSTAFSIYNTYLYSSISLTTYGFGMACILIFRSTLNRNN